MYEMLMTRRSLKLDVLNFIFILQKHKKNESFRLVINQKLSLGRKFGLRMMFRVPLTLTSKCVCPSNYFGQKQSFDSCFGV